MKEIAKKSRFATKLDLIQTYSIQIGLHNHIDELTRELKNNQMMLQHAPHPTPAHVAKLPHDYSLNNIGRFHDDEVVVLHKLLLDLKKSRAHLYNLQQQSLRQRVSVPIVTKDYAEGEGRTRPTLKHTGYIRPKAGQPNEHIVRKQQITEWDQQISELKKEIQKRKI